MDTDIFQDLEAGGKQGSSYIIDADHSIRRGFIRKVYGVLTLQMMLTIGMAAVFMLVPSINQFVISTPSLFYVAMALSLGVMFPLVCYRKSYPANLVLLGVWTFVEAYTLGLVCAIYANEGSGMVVLQAFIITFAIFFFLTAVTFVSKIDFSFLGFGLMIGTVGLLVWGFIAWVVGWNITFVYSLIGAILFSLWILYDTSQILHRLEPDDWVIACVELYLDILNLFLFILTLLSSSDNDRR
jgi:FtsH-binding integral membrane protein